MGSDATIQLQESFFGDAEKTLVAAGELSASLFRYPGGVAAVRLENRLGRLVLLPFQGQQVWSAQFQGRELAMRSMFSVPRPTRAYLETYGAFFLHCGATAMGVPARDDTHPLHGELPNAPYGKAWLTLGEDARGRYLALGGEYEHVVAFATHYAARPEVRLYAGSTRFPIGIAIHNLKRSPMEVMYLAHANFRPVDHGRLIYSAPCLTGRVRLRTGIPAHIRPPAGYAEFLADLAELPERHNVLEPGLPFDPEIVLYLDYIADEKGWAHTLQVHPDGSADYLGHRPDQLRHGIRWISRTPDQDALGLCLPATAEPEGYLAEKRKGNVGSIPPGGSVRYDLEVGVLTPEEARDLTGRIGAVLAKAI